MTPSLLRAAAALAAAALLLIGCAGGGPVERVATTNVDLPPSYKFAPADISVSQGATVTWTNNDNFTHSVKFTDGGLPAEPLMMSPGQSVEFTFATAGEYHYICSLHPQDMKGSVLVTQ